MIFIVDDSPTDIELTTIALEATGREIVVRFATDGKSALAMLRNGLRVPALILLDLKMPGMDGIEVLRQLRHEADPKRQVELNSKRGGMDSHGGTGTFCALNIFERRD